MRLKLIVRDQQGDRDVVVTCDATATIGDVAAALAGQTDTQRRTQPLTLWAHAPGAPDAQTLNLIASRQAQNHSALNDMYDASESERRR